MRAALLFLAIPLAISGNVEPTTTEQSILESVASPIAYRITPDSRFDVVTGKAGLFGAFGHKHRIRATEFDGTIVYDSDNPFRSSIEIVLQTASLVVVPEGADEKDGPKVERAMRESVLPPDQYPTIEFGSRIVTAIDDGVQVVGDLVIAERARPVAVDVTVAQSGDTLRATGTFSVKQTDFGIKPYSAAGGTIKVADEVTFDFEAVAIRVVEAE
jgi:polyisoprenoid-binding protein YceI